MSKRKYQYRSATYDTYNIDRGARVNKQYGVYVEVNTKPDHFRHQTERGHCGYDHECKPPVCPTCFRLVTRSMTDKERTMRDGPPLNMDVPYAGSQHKGMLTNPDLLSRHRPEWQSFERAKYGFRD